MAVTPQICVTLQITYNHPFTRANQSEPKISNNGCLDFKDFHPTKIGITPQNMPQAPNSPVITHLISGCESNH